MASFRLQLPRAEATVVGIILGTRWVGSGAARVRHVVDGQFPSGDIIAGLGGHGAAMCAVVRLYLGKKVACVLQVPTGALLYQGLDGIDVASVNA